MYCQECGAGPNDHQPNCPDGIRWFLIKRDVTEFWNLDSFPVKPSRIVEFVVASPDEAFHYASAQRLAGVRPVGCSPEFDGKITEEERDEVMDIILREYAPEFGMEDYRRFWAPMGLETPGGLIPKNGKNWAFLGYTSVKFEEAEVEEMAGDALSNGVLQ